MLWFKKKFNSEDRKRYDEFLKNNFGKEIDVLIPPRSKVCPNVYAAFHFLEGEENNYIVSEGGSFFKYLKFTIPNNYSFTSNEFVVKLPKYIKLPENEEYSWVPQTLYGIFCIMGKSRIFPHHEFASGFDCLGVEKVKNFRGFYINHQVKEVLELSNGRKVGFVNIEYLKDDELELISETMDMACDQLLKDLSYSVLTIRDSFIKSGGWINNALALDNGLMHQEKISKYNYPVDNKAGLYHDVILLRYLIENDFLNKYALDYLKEDIEKFKETKDNEVLMDALINKLNYSILMTIINRKGYDFLIYSFFIKDDEFRKEIDNYAKKYFEGKDTSYMNDDEYLFLNLNDEYYNAIKEKMDILLKESLEAEEEDEI